jgi:hypothetical protein
MVVQNKQIGIWVHILAIVLFIGSRFVFKSPLDHSATLHSLAIWREVFRYVLLVAFFYFHYYFIIAKYYYSKQIIKYIFSVFGWFMLVTFLPNLFFQNTNPPTINVPYHFCGYHFHPFFNTILNLLLDTHNSYYPFISIWFLSVVMHITSRLKQIASEKMETELAFLKAQINPHFLFNSLNSIYSLALSKSDKAPDAVLKLSEMMRYVTDESKNEFVPLDKEVNYLNNYIELQTMRMPASTKLEYKISITEAHKQIAPLILIHFIENAFKHGLSTEVNSTIQIDIICTDDELSLYTANPKLNSPKYNQGEDSIGLQNTVNRLEFMYPNKHKLTIDDTPTHYFVTLKMNLI